MKTAMQDLIGFIDFLIKDCHHYESTRISQLVVIKERAKEYLEKEKEQMLNFYMWMRMNENTEKYLDYSDEDMFKEYLNQDK